MERDDERAGGDPPCWAHLFEDDGADGPASATDLPALAAAASSPGATWSSASEDLNANLVVFDDGDGVAEHVNADIDVLLVGVLGVGVATIDGKPVAIRPGRALLVPRGARRAIGAVGGRFAYLTCHRRRPGLMPTATAGESIAG